MSKPTPRFLVLWLFALAPGCQSPGIVGTAGSLSIRGVAADELPTPETLPLPSPFAHPEEAKLDAGSLLAQPEPFPDLQASPRGRLTASRQEQGFLGDLTAKVTVQEVQPAQSWEDPTVRRTWQAEHGWKCGLTGPAFVFGQMGASSDEPAQADLKVNGRTGLGCKVAGEVGEVTVKGGPGVTYTDPLRPERTLAVPDWQVSVQAKCSWLFGAGLEYQGTAVPAVTPADHDKVSQDLSLAIPVGEAGKFQIGARRHWEANVDPKTGADNHELYLGFQIKR